jgi:LPPG:FO 2-phospho-L-lactate transferase
MAISADHSRPGTRKVHGEQDEPTGGSRLKVVALSGGVGGSRMLRGLSALDDIELTAIVNVGDDEVIYGVNVSPDIDTVIYTLAGTEGSSGWGLADDTHSAMEALEKYPIDTWFHIGDADLATSLFRTARLRSGWTLSQVTTAQAAVYGIAARIVPATDDPVRTEIHVVDEGWIAFQTYFVDRQHRSPVDDVRYSGAFSASPAPGVLESLAEADVVMIGPSNPPLSIWPILAIDGIADAVAASPRVVAVSPLFGGRPLKGPADVVMEGLGLPPGSAGVVAAYEGLLTELVVDTTDVSDTSLGFEGIEIRALPTRISSPEDAAALAAKLLSR